jgi:hypothetical protein
MDDELSIAYTFAPPLHSRTWTAPVQSLLRTLTSLVHIRSDMLTLKEINGDRLPLTSPW